MSNRSAKPRRSAHAEALSQEFYRLLADRAPQLLWAALPDGSTDFFNARILEYTGRTQQQLEGWGWRSVVHPEDWERCLARWTKAFKRGQPYEVEYRLRRRDGRYLWHLGAATPHREGGRIVRWFGSCTEIENQKRAERLLQKARETLQVLVAARAHEPEADGAPSSGPGAGHGEERLRSMMTLSSDFFWETDSEHRFTTIELGGRFAPVMFVATRLGKKRWESPSVLPDDAGWHAHRETLEARREFRDFETARVGDDGLVHYYSIDGEPVYGERGEFLGYRGVGREITARKLAERALRESGLQFRAFLDSMPAIAWIKDSRFRYTWVSASYERVLGKPLQQVEGRENVDVWPEDLARRYRRHDEDALRANGPVQAINDVPCADGSIVRMVVVKFPLPDGAGAPGIAGIGFEVSARDVGEPLPESADADNPLERLSARERQVLQMIVNGSTSAEVGRRLGLSPKSVDTYRSRLMTKLAIDDLPSLVKFALRHGLTSRR